ncbi:MAG: sugar transferase [Porphyromonadaceae bacterium]|nr:sugar transferase [Porphyromonadaceae bacterium]
MNSNRQIAKYVISDWIAVNVGWFLFNIFRFYIFPINRAIDSLPTFLSYPKIIEGQIIFPLFFIGIFYLSGYYNCPFLKSRLEEFFTTIFSLLIGTLIIFFFVVLNDLSWGDYSYSGFIAAFALQFVCVYPCRFAITSHATKKIHTRKWGNNTLIIGSGKKARTLAAELNSQRKSQGFNLIGYVESETDTSPLPPTDLPQFKAEQLQEIIKKDTIKQLIVALDGNDWHSIQKETNLLYKYDLPILVLSDNYATLFSTVKMTNILGTPLINITTCALSESQKNIKRLCDILLSSLALVLLSPVIIGITLAIRATSPGKIIYRQQRVGFRQKEFTLYKFRSMIFDAEESGVPILSSENDTRVTPIGHFLRKYRLDEIPQFWNILKGDMSLVGPRPERRYFVDQLLQQFPHYNLIHQLRPGLTSWGMVKFGYARNIEEMGERLKYEMLYLENISLMLDLKIIIYTIKTVLAGKGM